MLRGLVFAFTVAIPIQSWASVDDAEVLSRLGQHDRAIAALHDALAQSPQDIRAREMLRREFIATQNTAALTEELATLCDAYIKAHERDLAEARLDELVALSPNHPDRARFEAALNRTPATVAAEATPISLRLRSFLGIFAIIGLAYLMSNNRKAVRWRIVAWGVGLQFIFGAVVLWSPPGRKIFDMASAAVDRVLAFTDAGAGFLFGNLYRGLGAGNTGPLSLVDGTTGDRVQIGLVFAFHVLPTIVFVGSLMAVLYHAGIIQKVVHVIATAMQKTMGLSGAEALSTAANIFVGQTEAPLVVKPYVATMTNSELMAIMVGGFATVAGGVLAAYVRFGVDAGHLMAASIMAAPAGIALCKIMIPEVGKPLTAGKRAEDPPKSTDNMFDAAALGASEGIQLAINVAAMLIAFTALVAMINYGLSLVGLSLTEIFGYVFYPLAYVMGAENKDLMALGNLLGLKISLNEFVAYVELAHIRSQISPRTFVIATYALCGFANFASIGIQIGGIGAMAPERRGDIAKLGLRAMICGMLATCMTACVAAILI